MSGHECIKDPCSDADWRGKLYDEATMERGVQSAGSEEKLASRRLVNAATLTDSDLDAEIQRGLDDLTSGRTRPCPKQAFPDPIALKGDLPSLDDFDAAKKARRK